MPVAVDHPEARSRSPIAAFGAWRRVLCDSGYALAALPLSIVGFTVAVTGLSLAAGLAVTPAGAPVALGTVWALRQLADAERILARLLGKRLTAPPLDWGTGGPWRRVRRLAGRRDVRAEFAFHVGALPGAVLAFSVAVSLWAMGPGLVLAVVFPDAWLDGDVWIDDHRWLSALGGAALVLLTPWLVRASVAPRAAMLRLLAGSSPDRRRDPG